MSKKNAIILILAVFIGSLGALVWFYFNNNKPQSSVMPVINTDVYDPFGTVGLNTGQNIKTEEKVATTSEQSPATVNNLRQISIDPIAGYGLLKNKDGQNVTHYILRATGNIYEGYTESTETKRLSNTTIPKIYNSVWLADGQKLILQYLKENNEDIVSFSVKINPATSTTNEFEGGVDGVFLPEDIKALAVNPASDKIIFESVNLNGSSFYVSKTNGLDKKVIFESPLTEWLISWPKADTVTLTTKPAGNVPGFMYFLNVNSGLINKIIGGINGLTSQTNSRADLVLYSDSSKGAPRLYLYNLKRGESKLLPWNTLPEKCVFGSDDNIYCAVPKTLENEIYPDAWYQGLVSFSDNIWSYNIEKGNTTLISDLEKNSRQKIDATDLKLTSDGSYLFFNNKNDLTLWTIKLK